MLQITNYWLQSDLSLPIYLLQALVDRLTRIPHQATNANDNTPFHPILIVMLLPNLKSLTLEDIQYRPTTFYTRLLPEIVAHDMGRILFQRLERVYIYTHNAYRNRYLSEFATVLLPPKLKVLKTNALASYLEGSHELKPYA